MADNKANEIQNHVRSWWQSCPMTYDWHRTMPFQEGSWEYFEEIDRRFFKTLPNFANRPNEAPFSRLIPFDKLCGKRVLEIGCGSGAHARLMAQAGADLTAIDLTERAIQLTSRRLQLWNLMGQVTLMDAENLLFEDNYFDFIWTWGVIHHSAHTDRIIVEMARVLKSGGEARIMVYHRHSFIVLYSALRGLLTGRLLKMSLDEVLNYYSDGYIARHYTASQFLELLNPHFSSVQIQVFGQKTEAIPLPGTGIFGNIKSSLINLIPETLFNALLRQWGRFLFVTVRK